MRIRMSTMMIMTKLAMMKIAYVQIRDETLRFMMILVIMLVLVKMMICIGSKDYIGHNVIIGQNYDINHNDDLGHNDDVGVLRHKVMIFDFTKIRASHHQKSRKV